MMFGRIGVAWENWEVERLGRIGLVPWMWAFLLAMGGTSSTALGQAEDSGEAPYFAIAGVEVDFDGFPLTYTDASVHIVGPIAEVVLTQVYENRSGDTIDATYIFPGSTRAAVNGLEMQVGDRLVRAKIQEKKKAQAIFKKAKAAGKTASLLEQKKPNVFSMNLANIPPGEVVETTLTYTEWLESEEGEYEFVYPMAARSYGAAGEAEGSQGEVACDLTIALETEVALESVSCDTHQTRIEYLDTDKALISLDPMEVFSEGRDFILSYSLSGSAVKSGLMISESPQGNYFFATIQPPARVRPDAVPPREYIFIMDVSGSMTGFPLDTAKELIFDLVVGMDERDSFNAVLFAGDFAKLSEKSLPASETNREEALRFVSQHHGGGGTSLLPALREALVQPKGDGVSRSLIVITDGYVNVEEAAFELIRSSLGDANLFAFGIGGSVNRYLVEGMARVGKGEAFIVTNKEMAGKQADRLREYVSQPVLTDLRFQFEGVEAYDVEPPSLPDLLAQRPVAIFGKWQGPRSGELKLSGISGHGNFNTKLSLANAKRITDSRALEFIWARERIRRLSDFNRLRPNDERIAEITRLGLEHSLLTKHTSFVAVDEVARREGENRLAATSQPRSLPKGAPLGKGSGQSVPVTPEPGMLSLLVVAAIFGALLLWRERRNVEA